MSQNRKDFTNTTLVAPQPVLVIATYDENGNPDAMPAGWGMQCAYHELILFLDTDHKTTENIRKTGAFTVSPATVETKELSDYFGLVSGNKVPDKVTKVGTRLEKSTHVNAPILLDYPITLECTLKSIEDDGKNGTTVIGTIVNMSVDERILDEKGKVDLDKAGLVCFDMFTFSYRRVGEVVGKAYSDGKILKESTL